MLARLLNFWLGTLTGSRPYICHGTVFIDLVAFKPLSLLGKLIDFFTVFFE